MDYQDPQIAAIYEMTNPLAEDGEFYLSLAGTHSCSVLDLGCGTGTLCCALGQRGHRVTGVDPAAAMLAIARSKPYAEHVEWIESSAQEYRSQRRFDLVIMTGHAFQVLLRDNEMLAALETMQRHLKEGGRVAFESRNPHVDWVGAWTGRSRVLSDGQITETITITGAEGPDRGTAPNTSDSGAGQKPRRSNLPKLGGNERCRSRAGRQRESTSNTPVSEGSVRAAHPNQT